MENNDAEFLKNLPDVTVFLSTETYFGVPAIIFIPSCIFSLALGFLSIWVLGVLLALVLLSTLIYMHKDDQDALYIYIANIGTNPHCWISGFTLNKQLIIIEDGSTT